MMQHVVMRGIVAVGKLTGDSDAARRATREILRSRRYRDVQVRRPFDRQLTWVGKRLDRFFRWIGRQWDRITPDGTVGSVVNWLLFGLLIAALALLVLRALRKRSGASTKSDKARTISFRELDAAANAAYAAGDFRRAIEIRFRIGIERLDRAHIPASRRTNAALRSTLIPPFEPLARTFDRAHYSPPGSETFTRHEADEARDQWPEVLDAAKGRSS